MNLDAENATGCGRHGVARQAFVHVGVVARYGVYLDLVAEHVDELLFVGRAARGRLAPTVPANGGRWLGISVARQPQATALLHDDRASRR